MCVVVGILGPFALVPSNKKERDRACLIFLTAHAQIKKAEREKKK